MSPQIFLSYKRGLQRLSKHSLHVGTASSGTDIVVLSLSLLSKHWKKSCAIDVDIVHAYSVENNVNKQEFIYKTFGVDCFVCNSTLVGSKAVTAKGVTKPIIQMGLFIAGFTCKARSKLNKHAKANIGCCKRFQESTGESLLHIFDAVRAHRPKWVILENLRDLMQAEAGAISIPRLAKRAQVMPQEIRHHH